MLYKTGLVLAVAALLVAQVQAHAENTATPVRVPFSAFRVKPILDLLHHDKPLPKSVQAKTAAGSPALSVTRIVKPRPKPAAPAATAQPQAPEAPQAQARPAPRPPVAPAPETAAATASAFGNGKPVPPRKPGMAPVPPPATEAETIFVPATPQAAGDDMVGDGGAYVPPPLNTRGAGIERIQAEIVPQGTLGDRMPGTAATPRPPYDGGPDSPADSVVRARGRFGDDDRTAGSLRSESREGGRGDGSRLRVPSFGISGLRVDRLEDAQGVSPVLLPGETQTVAAPDYQNMLSQGGVPHDVVVFFRENSEELEAGQMDVVASDVLDTLRKNPELRVEITGFAEAQPGGGNATDSLARARAMAIRDYLAGQAVQARRLTVKAKGDDTKVEPRDRVEMYFSR